MSSRIGPALTYLRGSGFRQIAAPRGWRVFEGVLNCHRGEVKVRLEINDWEFIDYPIIRLQERPPFLAEFLPHLLVGSSICYFAPGAVVLDRYRPDGTIALCLAQATEILNKLVDDPNYRQREFQREFGASWAIGEAPRSSSILLGQMPRASGQMQVYFLGDAKEWMMVSNRPEEVLGLCQARGWSASAAERVHSRFLSTSDIPLLPAGGLPGNVSELFAWLKLWSRTTYNEIQSVLGERAYLSMGAVLFIVRSPAGPFGFMFYLDAMKTKAYSRRPTLYRNFLHRHGKEIEITRLAAHEVGSDFIHSRNLRFPTLKDKAVTLIGCGAIGGYVAQALAKLGAGTGAKGKLVLIDPEHLQPENLGRHVLGTESLFKPKVEALSALLIHQFPGLNIIQRRRKAESAKDVSGDLVINASGMEALSVALNAFHVGMPKSRPPLLHTWILGNGECVQGLWVDSSKFACFRCLRQNDADCKPRFAPLKVRPETRVHGCTAFTPYAVSAPLSAAALTIDMVAAWLEGDPSPRFRTRLVEGKDTQTIKNQNLSRLETCPACRRI